VACLIQWSQLSLCDCLHRKLYIITSWEAGGCWYSFVKTEHTYPCTQKQHTGPYAESDELISYPVTLRVCRPFNIITLSTRLKKALWVSAKRVRDGFNTKSSTMQKPIQISHINSQFCIKHQKQIKIIQTGFISSNHLTPRTRALLEQLTVFQWNSKLFMKFEYSLPCPQQPTTTLYVQSSFSSLRPSILFL
jgi:hypothetical protein